MTAEIPSTPKVVVSGDMFTVPTDQQLTIGPGLCYENGLVKCTKAGVIRHNASSVWVDRNSKRYIPVVEERVIGVVLGRIMEEYRVDIGAAVPAMLNSIAFEGATNRNKPDLKSGNLVYARVIAASKDVEPELACVNSKGKSNGLQVLEEGHMIQCSLGLCRKLRQTKCTLTEPLLRHFTSFELCVGLNGRVWIRSDSVKHTVVISLYLTQCERLSVVEADLLLKQLIRTLDHS